MGRPFMEPPMRALPILFVGGAILAVAAGAVLTPLAYADPAPDRAYVPAAGPAVSPAAAPVLTDADRRAQLDARLQAMLKSGQGQRLTDAKAAPRPVARRNANRDTRRDPGRSAPRPVSRQVARATPSGAEPVSTIAPPPTRGFSLAALGRPRLDLKTPPVVPSDPIECLTQAIYYEARSESEEGQAAVAAVVMNRSRSGRYPKDVCQVVYQRNSRTCQFTFTCDGAIGRRPVNMTQWARAERIAREVHEGRSSIRLPDASVNYHANYVRPSWGARLERVRQIGAHIFYGAPLAGFSTPGAEDQPATVNRPGGLVFVDMATGQPVPESANASAR